MNINMHVISTAVDIHICTSIEDIEAATRQDSDLQRLMPYIIQGWPYTKDEVKHSIQKYWPIRNELVMIDGIAMKGK